MAKNVAEAKTAFHEGISQGCVDLEQEKFIVPSAGGSKLQTDVTDGSVIDIEIGPPPNGEWWQADWGADRSDGGLGRLVPVEEESAH
jgi:hypothetical protein